MWRIHKLYAPLPSLVLACVLVLGTTALIAFQKADPAAFSGTWKLDVPASTNPNGPAAATPGARGGGGGGGSSAGGSRGGGGDTGGGQSGGGGGGSLSGPPPGGSLGPQEKARLYAMLAVLEHAPATLVITATDKDVTFIADGSKPAKHMIGKTEKAPTGNEKFGNLEIKTRWDGASLKREIKTIDGLTVAETYTVAPGGKQLTVSLELKSQVERLADAQHQPIKRIYNRAQ